VTASSEQVIRTPRIDVTTPKSGLVTPTGAALLAAFPPRPIASSWPATGMSRSAVLAKVLAAPFTLGNLASQQTRRLGVLAVLSWLQTHPGDSWQQRWQASGAQDQTDWRAVITATSAGRCRAGTAPGAQLPHLSPGLLMLICADVIRPSLDWLLRFAPARRGLAAEMARTRDTTAFAALAELCTRGVVGLQTGQQALTRVAVILAAKGGPVAAVGVGDCVQLLQVAAGMRATSEVHAHSPLFYQLLRNHGVLGPDAPAAIEMFSGRGQPTCEQLIDRYQIACRPVRDVLVDYLRERQPSVDFSSLQRFAYLLGKLFWADLQAHHPGIDSLKLPREVAAAWKQRVMTRTRATTSPTGEQVQLTAARLDGRSVWTGAACCRRCGPSISTSPSGPMTTRPGGDRGRCAARSTPATCPTRRTGPGASPAWTNAPGNGCRCCQHWCPGSRPSGPAPPSCSAPPKPPSPVHCSPPRARRCAAR
jgi:hypothetical protein